MSSGSPDSPEQSLTTPNPSPDLSDLRICIPKPPAVSPNPCTLSPISIQSNWPFPTPTTSPKPVQHFSVMLTLSDLIFCSIGPRPLPNALGSFPVPSSTLSDQYLAHTTSLKPYGPSPVFLTYANLQTHIAPISYPDTLGFPCYVYSVYGSPTWAYLTPFGFPNPCLAFLDLLWILFLRFDLYSLGFLSCPQLS